MHECNDFGLEEGLAAETGQHQDRHRHRAKSYEGEFLSCRVSILECSGTKNLVFGDARVYSGAYPDIIGCIPGYTRVYTRVYSGLYPSSVLPVILGCIRGYCRGYTPRVHSRLPQEYILEVFPFERPLQSFDV